MKNSEQDESSRIDNIQKDLYARDESQDMINRQEALSRLAEREVDFDAAASKEKNPEFADVMGLRAKKRRQILIGGGIAGAVIVILLVVFFGIQGYRSSRVVTEDSIGLSVSAPEDFTSGQDITYTLNYANDSRVDWEGVEILFTPAQGFNLKESDINLSREGQNYRGEIGNLAVGERGQITITGSLIGEQETVALAVFDMSVTPTNFSQGTVSKSVQVSTVIAVVPLEVSIRASERASHGDRVIATIMVRNVSDTTITGAYIELDPSVGTQLAIEDEAFSGGFIAADAMWELPPLDPLEEAERVAVLYVEGQEGEHRPLRVEVGIEQGENKFIQRALTHLITMSTPDLFVEQAYNGSSESQVVYPGDKIEGVVRYKNVGTIGLKNIIIQVSLEGVGFDPATLNLQNGAYDPRTRVITWSPATVPELATLLPQAEGEIKYSFSILKAADFPSDTSMTGEGYSVVSIATIDSPDLPLPQGQERKVVTSRHVLSVGTNMTLEADAFYDDGRLGINSYGPLPPKVGEETAYTIRFRLGSSLNDIGDSSVVAVLPDGVRYTGEHYKTSGDVDYNERTGEVTWSVPLADRLSGRARPPQELHIQVAIAPGENQRGNVVSLVRSIKASGRDLFVDRIVEVVLDRLPTTETASPRNGRVE